MRICWTDVDALTDHRMNTKECEKLRKYHNLATRLNKIWYIESRLVLMILRAIGAAPKTLPFTKRRIFISIVWTTVTKFDINQNATPLSQKLTNQSPEDKKNKRFEHLQV